MNTENNVNYDTLSEEQLIQIAQNDLSDENANRAMKVLKTKFDPTYVWCSDCDGLVTKIKDCCMYQNPDDK